METSELKKGITQFINNIEDKDKLLAIQYFVYNQIHGDKDIDFWDSLPEEVKESIERGLEQSKQGNLIPHDDVMQTVKSKYSA